MRAAARGVLRRQLHLRRRNGSAALGASPSTDHEPPPGATTIQEPTNGERGVAAGIADAALLVLPALALARMVSLPLAGDADVVSATTRLAFDPRSNYLQFAIFVVLVGGAFALAYRRGVSLVERGAVWLAKGAPSSAPVRVVACTIAVLLAVAFTVNTSTSSVTHALTDDFHEGEYLGFVPHVRTGLPLAQALTVHGPGVDLLPAYVAVHTVAPGHRIVAARAAYSALRAFAVFAAFACIVLLCGLLQSDVTHADPATLHQRRIRQAGEMPCERVVTVLLAVVIFAAALRVGGWPDEPALHKPVNARDAVYLLQIALALSFVRAKSRVGARSIVALALSFAFGLTLALGPIYSYDRGLYGFAFALLLSFALGPWRAPWLAGIAGGALAGAASLLAILSPTDLAAAWDQIGFWIANGRALWAQRGLTQDGDLWTFALLSGAMAAVGYAIVRVAKAWRTQRSAIVTLEPGLVVMIAAALPYLRMAIERSDSSHIAWALTPAWMLAAALAAHYATRLLLSRNAGGEAAAHTAMIAVCVSATFGWTIGSFDPWAAAKRIEHEYVRGLVTMDDATLSPSQLATRDAMGAALARERCFVTLTNEGTWHYVFDIPSCTRYYQITNARTAAAQAEAIRGLDIQRPEWILFANDAWSNVIDGISFFNASPTLAAWVMTHYAPAKEVAGNWFWRRRDAPSAWSDTTLGIVESAPPSVTRRFDARVTGSVAPASRDRVPDALLLTEGDSRRPLWSGRPDANEWKAGRWSLLVPTAALPPGDHRLQAWTLSAGAEPAMRLGESFAMRFEKADGERAASIH